MSKITNPKAWYLLGAGAVALAADGARRLLRRRRADGSAGYRSAEVPMEADAPAKVATTAPVVTSAPTAEAQAKTKKAVEEKGPASRGGQEPGGRDSHAHGRSGAGRR